MKNSLKAIEVEGAIDAQRQLHLDEPLPVSGPSRVRVIILLPAQAEVDEDEWLHAAANSSSYDFLKEPQQDIYTPADGKPFHDQR